MRTFKDADNTEWTVFEVRRQASGCGQWAYLPQDYGEGWLCFESARGKRRQPAFPPNWEQLGNGELLRLLHDAQPAKPLRHSQVVLPARPSDGHAR